MDIERDIKDICETLRDEELYTEAMAIKEIIEIQNARIQGLGEEVRRADELITEISIYWGVPQPLKEKIIAYQAHNLADETIRTATEALKEGEDG